MKDEFSDINEKWKSVGYLGAGFAASQVTKVLSGNTIESHVEAEMYHGGNRKKSNQDIEKATFVGGLVGTVFGAVTGFLSKGEKGILEGAVMGGISGAGLTLAEKKLKQ